MANKKFPAVYEHSRQQAVERNELKQYHASWQLNTECAKAIDAALTKHYDYDSYCLDTAAASKEVAGQFGMDRMMFVLASTVRFHERDGRFSPENKEWARTIPAYDDRMSAACLVRSHPGLTNLLVNQVRHELLLAQPLKAGEVKAEAERLLSEFRSCREPNSSDGKQFEVWVSPDFMERAKPRNIERLKSMLPFSSLNFIKARNGRDTYALIDKDEDRSQPLQLRKPSIKEKLAANAVHSERPAAQEHQQDKGAR